MNQARKQKLIWISLMMLGLAAAVTLALYALRQNINLFYTPSQVAAGKVPEQQTFRIGGLVVPGSVHHASQGLAVSFALTDKKSNVTVDFKGILPDLFREGQGIVAIGHLNAKHVFEADTVLAKHDANYMPPEVKAALAQAKQLNNKNKLG